MTSDAAESCLRSSSAWRRPRRVGSLCLVPARSATPWPHQNCVAADRSAFSHADRSQVSGRWRGAVNGDCASATCVCERPRSRWWVHPAPCRTPRWPSFQRRGRLGDHRRVQLTTKAYTELGHIGRQLALAELIEIALGVLDAPSLEPDLPPDWQPSSFPSQQISRGSGVTVMPSGRTLEEMTGRLTSRNVLPSLS